MRKLLFVIILLLAVSVVQAQGDNAGNEMLGINLAGIADWATEHPFVDVFKTARTWISQRDGAEWGQGGELALTPEGWVAALDEGQYAETLMFSADVTMAEGLDGQYTILYDGEGALAFRGSNVTVVSEEAGRMVVEVRATQGAVFLQIVETNADNPLRNIHFLMPGTEATYETQPFNPVFLERISRFTALRFMDWMGTNNSPISAWADRPLPSDATFAWRGVPVETMVLLANTVHADAWFNMPHSATDEYVREFATYVRDHLDADLKAYIEYSNETWNGQFQQANYVVEQGLSLNLAEGDAFWSGLRYHSQRAVEMFAIWEEVFGGTARLVRVLASQAGNAWTGEQVADFQGAAEHADALTIAPYFSCDDPGNPSTADQIAALTVDALLDRQMANVQEGGCAYQYMVDNLSVAQQYGLELVAYEGGQHLAGYGGAENNQALTDLFIAANRHPRMTEIYLTYLRAWQALGGGVFMAFTDAAQPSMFGSWGALEYIRQDPADAPKYQALMMFIDALQGE
ncbi:MAG: hypothetical protein U0694_08050 [Anaerolineae bacterium]